MPSLIGNKPNQVPTNGDLGTMAFQDLVNFATAAQGVLADSSVQPTATQTLTNKTLTSPTLTTPSINSAQVPTVVGTAPLYMCRAWVNFNGTGTVAIRASGNVSSITDLNTGEYTVNFTTAMPDANYCTVMQLGHDGVPPVFPFIHPVVAPTASSITVAAFDIFNSMVVDTPIFNVAIFR
jgi:hypothetical protein